MNLQLEELRPLDLKKCKTVGDIVEGMRYSAFGARMLGEVAATLAGECRGKGKPIVIYDGFVSGIPLGGQLLAMLENGWFSDIVTPETYSTDSIPAGGTALIVGRFSERFEECLFHKPDRTIFVNQFDLAKPGQVRDGFFPDAVFADPNFVVPILRTVLDEWLGDKKTRVSESFMSGLETFGGVASQMAKGAAVLLKMARDKECRRFLTISGAMTIAKMDLVICEMIEMGFVNAVSCTGALMAHGLVPSIGLQHYKYNPAQSDTELARRKLNRVTDTLEPETNLDAVEKVASVVLENFGSSRSLTPAKLNRLIGKYLAQNFTDERGILKSAYLRKVPVFVPAFWDSELGNDLYIFNLKRRLGHRKTIAMDFESDIRHMLELVTEAKRFGIFTIGGGVPRNNVQNLAPLIEIINARLGYEFYPERRFIYGARICPDRMYYGHLSGCTYSENESWRKSVKGGDYAEIQADATQVWPFLVKYLMERG